MAFNSILSFPEIQFFDLVYSRNAVFYERERERVYEIAFLFLDYLNISVLIACIYTSNQCHSFNCHLTFDLILQDWGPRLP